MAITVSILSNQKMSNFHFDLSLKLSQGEVHDLISGEVQKFSGEACAPPLKIRPCLKYLTSEGKSLELMSYPIEINYAVILPVLSPQPQVGHPFQW